MIKDNITINIELTDEIEIDLEFVQYIKYFLGSLNTNIPIDFILYKSKQDKFYKILSDAIINSTIIITDTYTLKWCTFNVHFHTDQINIPSKFYFTYDSYSTFINSLTQLFSSIKALINYKESVNDNRNNRKRVFYSKARSKRTDAHDKD